MPSPLIVIATIRAKAGAQDQVRDALQGLLAPTRAEAGCLVYDLHQDTEDPTVFVFHEAWESAAHLDAHLASAHIAANRDRIGDVLEGLEIRRCAKLG